MLTRFAGRALLGSVFVNGGINQLKAPDKLAPTVERETARNHVPLPVPAKDLVTFNGGAMLVGGTALALGILPRAASVGLIASMIPTTLVGHPFWEETDPVKRMIRRGNFLNNAAIVGGLLLFATLSGSDED